MPLRRRTVLATVGATLVSAGCVQTDDNPPPDAVEESADLSTTPGSNETRPDQPNGDGTVGADGIQIDTRQGRFVPIYSPLGTAPDDPLVASIRSIPISPTDLLEMCERLPDECDEAAAEWVEQTDFDEGLVAQIALVAPSPAYDMVTVKRITAPDPETLRVVCGLERSSPTDAFEPPTGDLPVSTALVRIEGPELSQVSEVLVEADYETIELPPWFEIDTGFDTDAIGGWVAPDGDPPARPELPVCTPVERDQGRPHTEPRTGDEIDPDVVSPEESIIGTEAPSSIHRGVYPKTEGSSTWAMRLLPGAESDGSGPRFERGDEVRITMINVSGERQTTFGPENAVIDHLTAEGWRGYAGACCRDWFSLDQGMGGGHEWQFRLDPEEIAAGLDSGWQLRCTELPVGRYRFRYPVEDDYLGVVFDVVA